MAKTNVKSFDPSEKPAKNGWLLTLIFSLLSVFFVMPILVVLWNSFKVKSSINLTPFQLPNDKTFVGFENYIRGMQQINFFAAFVNTLTITVLSVIVIILCTSMCGWYIARVNSNGCKLEVPERESSSAACLHWNLTLHFS